MKATSNSFANIDNNRLATAKQFFRVTVHHANLVKDEMNIPEKFFFRLRKQVEAVLARHNPKGLTHGDVQKFLASKKLPKYLIGNLQILTLVEPKAEEQPKVAKKAPAKPKPKAVKTQPKAKKAPAKTQPKVVQPTATATPEFNHKDFDARLTFLEGEVSVMSEDIQTIKSGMEMILESIRG